MEKTLYRNEHDKMIAGVASGLADYMQVEITIVRLLFVLSAIFLAGIGLVAYIVMWIIVPVKFDPSATFSKFDDYFKNNPNAANAPGAGPNTFNNSTPPFTSWNQPPTATQEKKPFETETNFADFPKPNGTGRTVAGLVLVIIGCFFMLREFDLIPSFLRIRNLWPVLLIAIGASIIAKSRRKNDWQSWEKQNPFNAAAPQNTTTQENVEVKESVPTAQDDANNDTQVEVNNKPENL